MNSPENTAPSKGTPGKFQAVPDSSQLETVVRDFHFYPCQNHNPKFLSTEQIAEFNREGYLKGVRIYSEPEILDIRTYFDQLLAKVLASGQNSYSISTAHMKYGRVYDILTNPTIVNYVSDLLGDDVIAWGSHFFCKMPGDGKTVSWHQDASYWPLTPTRTVTVWLAIDQADQGNGCMKFIPGSHHFGHMTWHLSEESENNVLNQTVVGAEKFGEPIYDELKAGECSIHNDLLLHGSEANQSNRRRCGLTLRYCSAEVRAGMDWNQKGVIVRGSDPTNHWSNPPRPAND